MPVLTPKMKASVPCDNAWHKIHQTDGVNEHVFVKFNGAVCTFTARLIDKPAAPGGAPVVKKITIVPTAGGWRGLKETFDDFEVKCEHPQGQGDEPQPETPEQERPPQIEASRKEKEKKKKKKKKDDPAPALHECPFEWYMSVH